MVIREASPDDFPRLLEMGERFIECTPYGCAYAPDRIVQMLWHLLRQGVVLVAEEDGIVCGALLGMMHDMWCGNDALACELALWVDPARRGAGLATGLVQAFEAWGKEQGAASVCLSDLRAGDGYPAESFLKALGYRDIERMWTKEV
jgi:GNAT superfamily N-acetyltransferase